MSQEDALWADRLLEDVRREAEPAQHDVARNLAALEQRLQLGTSGSDVATRAGDGAAASAGTLLQLRPGVPPHATTPAGPLASTSSGWKSAAVLGRWLAFGATTALLGYLGGRAESRRELAELEQVQQRQGVQQAEGQQPRLLPRPVQPLEQTQPLPQVQPPREHRAPVRPRPAPARAALPRATVPHAPVPAPAAHLKSAPNQQLREAIELLQRAEAALRQGDAFAASLLLSDLDRSTPAHLLREERLVTRALVSCTLADESAASAALQELERLNPESIYRARLEGSCAEKKHARLPKQAPAPH